MTRNARILPILGGVLLSCLFVLAPRGAWANSDRYSAERADNCDFVADGSCTVCGREYKVDGGMATWGGIEVLGPLPEDFLINAFCTTGTGMTATGSAIGGHVRDLASTFSAIRSDGTNNPEVGSAFEIGHGENTADVYGLTIPYTHHLPLGPGVLSFPVSLALGFAKDVEQLGINLEIKYRYDLDLVKNGEAGSWRMAFSGHAPIQLTTTFFQNASESIDFVFRGGVGGTAAIVGEIEKWTVGLGFMFDFRATERGAWVAPFTIMSMLSYDFEVVEPALMLGYGSDMLTGDVKRAGFMLLYLGVKYAGWLMGYQGFLVNGYMAHGIGFVYTGKLF